MCWSSSNPGIDQHRFPFCRKLAAAFQNLDTDGAKQFSIRQNAMRHHDVSQLVKFIHENIFGSRIFHLIDYLREFQTVVSNPPLNRSQPNLNRLGAPTDLTWHQARGFRWESNLYFEMIARTEP